MESIPSKPSTPQARQPINISPILWANTRRGSKMPHPQHSQLLHTAVDDLLRLLQQPAPPSLRELLEAYSQKGNGDRELLLAMLAAKSSEDQVCTLLFRSTYSFWRLSSSSVLFSQRVAAVIQSHQTLIQAHAVAQQHQALVPQQIQHQAIAPASTPALLPPSHHLLSPSTPMIAPPSPSGTSQSQSSSSSPRGKQTTLPPLHTHLADLRSLPAGPQAKRRRTERDAMMLDSITSGATTTGTDSRSRRGRGREQESEDHQDVQLRREDGRYRGGGRLGGMPKLDAVDERPSSSLSGLPSRPGSRS